MLKWIIIIGIAIACYRACSPVAILAVKPGDMSAYNQVAELNRKMPMDINSKVQLNSIRHEGKLIRITGKQLSKQDMSSMEKEDIRKNLTLEYCKGDFRAIADANVPIEYTFSTPAHNLHDLSTGSWTTSVRPGDCS